MILSTCLWEIEMRGEKLLGSGTLQTCIALRIMTDYYFMFPSSFQEILIDQEHLLLNFCI